MSKWLHFCRKGLVFGVACGVVMVALAGQSARAGNITIYISETGKTPVSFDFTSPLASPTNPGDMNHLLADANGANGSPPAPFPGALNATLLALGYDFQFQSLSANSNIPGTGPGGGQLFMTGQVERFTTTGGDKTIQIDVSQNDYLTKPQLSLVNSATANFTNAPGGNNQLATSYFNSNNKQDDTTGPHTTTLNYVSTGTGPNSHPGSGEQGTSSIGPLGNTVPFSLTGRLVITLGQLSDNNAPPTDQFSLSTIVTVPEPASVALMGMGLPVVIVGLGWLRRRRAAA